MASTPLIVGLGEVLWDLLPSGPRLGGAPSNFAWMAGQLGAEGRVVSAVGADSLGKKLLAQLRKLQMETKLISVLPEHPTGTVSVKLDASGHARYQIQENVAWDYIPSSPEVLQLATQADAVCVGTLAQRAPFSHTTIQEFLDALPPDCLSVFDLNLRQKYYEPTIIRETLTKSQVLKMNQDEWPVIAQILGVNENFNYGLPALIERYGLQLIALTLGENGSVLASSGGLSVLEGISTKVVDTIGAGDAFTAALAIGLLRGDSIKQIQEHATRVAAYVCTQSGGMAVLPASLKAG